MTLDEEDDPTIGLVPDRTTAPDPNEEFYVLSLKYSGGPRDALIWWAPDCNGYTIFLEGAGIYTRKRVEERKLSDGENTLAIPVAIVRDRCRRIVHERDVHAILAAGRAAWNVSVTGPREAKLIRELDEVADLARRANEEEDPEERKRLMMAIESTARTALESAVRDDRP